MRSGNDINNKVCAKLKGVVDTSKTYNSAELLSLFRNNENLKPKDLLWWLFGGAEFFGSDSERELFAQSVLNQYITENQNNTGLTQVSCTNKYCAKNFWDAYIEGKTAEELETMKESILNIIEEKL